LIDVSGQKLKVEGLATARALILCSYGPQRQVKLPVDQTIMITILERYLTDLRQLLNALRQQSHQRMSNPRQAENLASRVWKRLQLPPPDKIDG